MGLVQLQLVIEEGSDPITGSLAVNDGRSWPFVGWIALVTALEEAMRTVGSGAPGAPAAT